jgi:hypothetical protein
MNRGGYGSNGADGAAAGNIFPWNTMCEAVPVARVDNMANLEMVALAVEVGPPMPGL